MLSTTLIPGGGLVVGLCEYCGLDAGVLRKHHKECEEKHERGWARMIQLSTEAARKGPGDEKLEPQLAALAKFSYVPAPQIHEALVTGWEKAADEAIQDQVLSVDEEKRLTGFMTRFGLSREELERTNAWKRLAMAATLRELLDGKIPTRMHVSGQLPFNFQRSETLGWLFNDVPYYEERTRTRYVGGSDGMSFRVAKGIYYRTSSFESTPVTQAQTVRIDSGSLAITTKHIYFAGARKGFRVPYRKIMAFQPFKDGFGIVRDAASAKPQVFVTEEGWFSYNLVRNLASRSPE